MHSKCPVSFPLFGLSAAPHFGLRSFGLVCLWQNVAPHGLLPCYVSRCQPRSASSAALSPGLMGTPTRAVTGISPISQIPLLSRCVRGAAIRCLPFPDQDSISCSDQPWAVGWGSHCTPPSWREHLELPVPLLTYCSGFSAVGPATSCSLSWRGKACV